MSLTSILGGAKDKIQEKADIMRDMQHNLTAQKYAPDWMRETELITGKPCRSWEEIAWDDPEISLQYWLTDAVHVKHLKNKKTRARALACLSPEQLEIYYVRRDGYSYSDIEKKGWKASVMSEVLHIKRKAAKESGQELKEEDIPEELKEELAEDESEPDEP